MPGGMQNWLVIRVGIEIDLNSVLGSKLTWFCVGDIYWLGFSMGTEIDLFFCGAQNRPCFCVRVENYLFYSKHGNLLGFCDVGRNWLDLSVGGRTWINFSLLYILRIVMLLLFSATLGGGSTGVIRETRHRPLLLVSYRTARIRELPPPADWPGH